MIPTTDLSRQEDCSDLQLKLKVMSECVRKRDLELSIQRQALDDRDRRMKDAQNEGHAVCWVVLDSRPVRHRFFCNSNSLGVAPALFYSEVRFFCNLVIAHGTNGWIVMKINVFFNSPSSKLF